MRACIRVRVYLHSPFSVVYSSPLSPLSSIFLQKEHGCALRSDLASTEIKSAGINTAYQCTKGKHNFPLTPFSITRTPTVHFHGSSNLWTFQTSFSFFLRMIFKKFKFNSFETFFSSMQRSFFRTEKWLSLLESIKVKTAIIHLSIRIKYSMHKIWKVLY